MKRTAEYFTEAKMWALEFASFVGLIMILVVGLYSEWHHLVRVVK